MNINDPGIAFLFIMQFIHRYGEIKVSVTPSSKNDLLEEIREVGFHKVIDTNDDFSKFKLKVDTIEILSLQLFKDRLEYSLDSFKDFPKRAVFDKKRGFLDRVLKAGLNDLKELERIYNLVFARLDEQFLTLQPERHDKTILRRRIHNNQSIADENTLLIYYNYESKQIIMNEHRHYSVHESDKLIQDLKDIIVEDEAEKECGICYSTYLDGQLTNLTCSNALKCKQMYHESCLREWFRSIPTSRTIFEKIGGNCLFCETVPIKDTRFILFNNVCLF